MKNVMYCALALLLITSCAKKDGVRITQTEDGKFAVSRIGSKDIVIFDSVSFRDTIRKSDRFRGFSIYMGQWSTERIAYRTEATYGDVDVAKEMTLIVSDSTGVHELHSTIAYNYLSWWWWCNSYGADHSINAMNDMPKRYKTDSEIINELEFDSKESEFYPKIVPVMITYRNYHGEWNMGVYHGYKEILPCSYQNLEFVGDYIVAISREEQWLRKIYYAPYPSDTALFIAEFQRCDDRARDDLPLFRNRHRLAYERPKVAAMLRRDPRTAGYVDEGDILCDDVLAVQVQYDSVSGKSKNGILYKTDGYFHFIFEGKEITDTTDARFPNTFCDMWTIVEGRTIPIMWDSEKSAINHRRLSRDRYEQRHP